MTSRTFPDVRRCAFWLAAIVGTGLVAAPARALAADSEGQVWLSVSASLRLAPSVNLLPTINIRASDAAEGVYQTQWIADVEYRLDGGVAVAGGYGYVTAHDGGSLTSREHRLRQQVSFPVADVAGGRLTGRVRIEERWRSDGDDMMVRIRPQLAWQRPIGPDGLALRLAHESFINLNDTDWGGEARYDRMRNALSVRRTLGSGFTGEVGYLNQYRFGAGGPDSVDHALTLALNWSP